MKNAIEVRNLKKTFADSDFFLDLAEFDVPRGYVTGLVGENGAGKTTLLKLLTGMLFPDSGSLHVLGMDLQKEGVKIRERIALIGEQTGLLYPFELKVIKKMISPFYGQWDETLFQNLIERFSLDLNAHGDALSRGQQKLFALAMAISHHPEVLLLDEPTANLDPSMREEILTLMREIMLQEDVTILFSTHITTDLDKLADQLRMFHKGKMLLQGDKDRLLEKHRIVKGGLELLQADTGRLLWNIERSAFGFTAMTDNFEAVYELFGNEAYYEAPDVERLFLAYLKTERGTTK